MRHFYVIHDEKAALVNYVPEACHEISIKLRNETSLTFSWFRSRQKWASATATPVSYTHLTLPTILLV